MALPERLYYTLDQSVAKINEKLNAKIDIDYLLHLASLGILELCVKIRSSNYMQHLFSIVLNIQRSDLCDESDINLDGSTAHSTFLYVNDFGQILVSLVDDPDKESTRNDYSIHSIDCLLSIRSDDIDDIVLPKDKYFSTNFFYIPKENNSPLLSTIELIHTDQEVNIRLNDLLITNKELELLIDNSLKQEREDHFTIEDYQNILFSLKGLVCSKVKKWSQDDINNELDNIQKGMSKRRLESMWSMLNKKFKS